MYGAHVFNVDYQLLEPLIEQATRDKKLKESTVALGTVAGDIHRIGKDIVKAMVIAEGFVVRGKGSQTGMHCAKALGMVT